MKLLDRIENPSDLRKLPVESLVDLAWELREFIIDVVATKEGHLGASLGVVELTLALHYVFNTPEDRLIWDVGHQAYGHKILTGRRKDFHTNRQLGGISGFPKRSESPYDAFGTGHASTSISAILGMALAARHLGIQERQHIAVIGDASIAGGMAFEALNHLGVSDTNVLIILNDNTIGIDPSVGALKEYLSGTKDMGNGQGNLFEDLNLYYEGPLDGHDLPGLIRTLQKLSERKGPKLLHITTTKGKGLRQAEENQVVYHAPGKFDKHTGELLPKHAEPGMGPKYQDVFGHTLVTLAELNPNIIGITPAMPTGSSLKYMMETFPDRAFDVGIAEQHAVTLAAGLATEGLIPYCAIYSTFLQRAYDQLIHDVALQELRVVFCLDRAGLVGRDGPTHHGIFDIAYLRCIPNMTLMTPMDNRELRNMLYSVQAENFGTVAIRYPRGASQNPNWEQPFEAIPKGRGRKLKAGNRVAVLSVGPWGQDVAQILPNTKDPDAFGHYDMRFIKPLDADLLREIAAHYEQIVTLEDGCKAGGFGSAVLEFLNGIGYQGKITILGLEDSFPPHGATSELRQLQNLTPDNIQTTLNQLI